MRNNNQMIPFSTVIEAVAAIVAKEALTLIN